MERLSNDRIGSPFAVDPVASEAIQPVGLATPVTAVPATELGPLNAEPEGAGVLGAGAGGTTASAAFVSAIVLLAFAALAWHFFPAGGVAVAALGIVMSVLGLRSRRTKLAVIALGLHAWLLFACFFRAL